MARRRILVVEDDAAIRAVLRDALELEGFETITAGTFASASEAAVRGAFDLVLLNLVLPGGDGLDVLRAARAARPTLPAIIITARGREEDRVRGLKLGADDYMVKPFGVKEVLARVEAVLRRSAERPLDLRHVRFAGGVADLERRELVLDGGAPCGLSEREVEILRYLAQRGDRTVTRDELMQNVWRLPAARLRTRAVDMHVARLRDKLGADVILTVHGKGYRFVGEPGAAE